MAKMTDKTIHDDVYVTIDDEFEQIRTSLGMYISKLGTEGALHLVKEETNNGFDEAVNPNALSRDFDILFDEVEQSYAVVDRSRGIPFNMLVDVCTKKHSSTKFDRDDDRMKDQAGRNGVGLVVIAACSKYMSLVSYRGDQSKTVEIVDGVLKDHKPVKLKKPQHGLAVKFIPSPEYLKGDVNIECYMIQDYLRHMSYIMREDLKINYYERSREMSDKDYAKGKSEHIIYKRKGLGENVKYISQNLEFAPVEISSVSEDFDLEVAFSYDKTIDDSIVESYCNYINTTEGGHHETVAQRAICDFFTREAKKLDPNSKYEVTFDDCRKGLIYCVNCKHKDPAFEGQHKSRVSNSDVLKDGKKMLVKELYNYFGSNNGLLRKIISYLRTISKVRLEAHKIKGISTKKQETFMDDAEDKMWFPIADRNYTGYAEIIVAEGDSAANSINTARNNRFQAVIGVQGVVSNLIGMKIEEIMSRPGVFRTFVLKLGCGYGKNFDITKLRYSKIILMADADVDGSYIDSLMLLFIVYYFPDLIIHGKVYRAIPPLMLLNTKNVQKWFKGSYAYSREEYYEIINKIISSNTSIAIQETDNGGNHEVVTVLKKKDYLKWLKMNAQYTTELDQLKARSACRVDVLEFVCYSKLVHAEDDPDEKKFKRMVEKRFEELKYNPSTHILNGSVEGESVTLVIDEIFWKSAKRFMRVLSLNPTIYIHVRNENDKTNDRYDKTTIGEFLFEMDRIYTVGIYQRYKGIGEMEADVIFATTLNPRVRRLVRFNIGDMKATKEMFEALHGKSPQMREVRRQILKDNPVSLVDLDN